MTGELSGSRGRACPVCGSAVATLFAPATWRKQKLSAFSYASRKEPEFMSLRLVRCGGCGLVYADDPPRDAALASAYASAAYDSGDEANCAARTYAACLAAHCGQISPKRAAIDVGAGNGALLPWLASAGFSPVVGIEPSQAAIRAADAAVRPLLREGIFARSLVADTSPSLICGFMILEHLADPAEFFRTAFDVLQPGGALAVVVHNRRGWVNRLLGRKSPIIDIEHLQLFDPRSLRELYRRAGFDVSEMRSFCNPYPLRYWVRLSPLPVIVKRFLLRSLSALSVDRVNLVLPAGNIFAIGVKKTGETSA